MNEFKKDFLWGVSTSSYQIEGAPYKDGKGDCIWDDFTKIPGKVSDNSSGAIACDHYNKYVDDVELMSTLSIKNYRFSINWSRVLPEGNGKVNQKGLDFYSKLTDELLKNDINPFITLYHWELPSELHRKGGWLNDDISKYFAEYADIVGRKLGDRVKNFITFNEPQCAIGLGYAVGEHAPGLKCSLSDLVYMSHNLMLSHGKAVKALRSTVKDSCIGYAPCSSPAMPISNSKEDILAAKKAYFATNIEDSNALMFSTAWFSDPVMLGKYPEDSFEQIKQYLPKNYKEDLKVINQKIDFYGQNIYHGSYYKSNNRNYGERVPFKDGISLTTMDWPITEDCLYWGTKFLHERYNLPIVITENGMSSTDSISLDGKVHDPARIDFLHRYLKGLKKAAAEGVDIKGYFQWSFMDNFEWTFGYQRRFGLVYVDYQTQKRIPKDSAYWYKKVVDSNGEII